MKIRLLLMIFGVFVGVLVSSCGTFIEIGDDHTVEIMGTHEAGVGFTGGKAISQTNGGRYTIEQQLNAHSKGAYMESTHYGVLPSR